MVPYSTPEMLALMEDAPAGKGPLAILCFSLDWQGPEQQTLWLAIQLHEKGRVLTLIVRDGSVLHHQAQAQGLPCLAYPEVAFLAKLRTAVHLGRWLRQQAIELLLTTRLADLGFAGSIKRWPPSKLWLIHRQFEPIYPRSWPRRWWLNWQLKAVDAWLSPLARSGQQMLTHTTLSCRQLWVVPPATLLSYFTNDNGSARLQGRALLKLPAAAQLIGVLDHGGDGPAFALEVLYRLQQEHNSDAELVVLSSLATPPDPVRWAALQELAQQLHLSHRVHLRPLHHAATPFLLYCPLDVLLLPSSQDATCLTVLEAMASGCPLVSAHTADAADLLLHGHTARLFPPYDVATCAKQLFVTLSAPAQSLLLAERAAAHVRQFYDPTQQSRQLESILEYVCQPQA